MQLVLVDGIPGSGKSVLAQTIVRRMRANHHHVRWCYEEELHHPIFLFQDMATLEETTTELFSGNHQRVVARALERWNRFAFEQQHSTATMVVDGTFFGYLTWVLQYLARPPDEAFAYLRQVEDALAPVPACLIYLRQRDVAATMRNLAAARGKGWTERAIRKVADSPYYRAVEPGDIKGFEALTRFWSDYQVLEDRLFDAVELPKLALDVTPGDWASAEASAANWLDLPPPPSVQVKDLESHVGAYRAVDGSVAHIALEDGNLCVRGLHQVWPGQKLVAIEQRTFEVLSLPFTVRFDDNLMHVDGPELLGGRPAERLTRVEQRCSARADWRPNVLAFAARWLSGQCIQVRMKMIGKLKCVLVGAGPRWRQAGLGPGLGSRPPLPCRGRRHSRQA